MSCGTFGPTNELAQESLSATLVTLQLLPWEGAGHLSMGLASVILGICPISCNNPIKKFLYLASANPVVR